MQSGRNQHSESMVTCHSLEVSVSSDFSCLMEKCNFFVMFNMNNKDEPYLGTQKRKKVRDDLHKKTGKMSDIEQKGGRGLRQNHSF